MTDRPFVADGDPAVAPEPGYYPDPSIPGFVRYWGGSAWVPGTSRPAPAEGEALQPPRFATRQPAPDPATTGRRAVPPPVAAGPQEPSARPRDTSGETGPVYLDQTTGGASFVVGPRVAEVIGGPVFRTVGPAAGVVEPVAGAVGPGVSVPAVSGSGFSAPGLSAPGTVVSAAAEPSGDSRWQADPQAQRGLMESDGAPRWVSWGVLPEAPEADEGRAEAGRAPAAVEVAAAVAPAMAVAVRELPAPAPEADGVAPVAAVRSGPARGATTVVAPEPGTEPEAERVAVPAPIAVPALAAPLPAVRPARQATTRRATPATVAAPVPVRTVPAGLGRRLAARAVDTVVLLVIAAAAGIPLARSVTDHLQQKLDQAKMASALTRRQVQVWLVDDVVLGKLAVLLGILLFASLLYEVLPVARTGQTFGKRLCRIRVVDAAPGGRARLSLGRSLLRWAVRQLGTVLLLGLVWPVFDRPARRGWQDRAARTRVVRG